MDADAEDVEVYQLHILLMGISPAIWRRVLVRSDSTVGDLHYAIQIAMGWSDDHLHRFLIHGTWYTIPRDGWYGWWVDFEQGRVVVYKDPDTWLPPGADQSPHAYELLDQAYAQMARP